MATVKVRVRGWIAQDGKWAIYGYTEASEDDADSVLLDMMDAEGMRPFWLIAEVEVPKAVEVQAAVEEDMK